MLRAGTGADVGPISQCYGLVPASIYVGSTVVNLKNLDMYFVLKYLLHFSRAWFLAVKSSLFTCNVRICLLVTACLPAKMMRIGHPL